MTGARQASCGGCDACPLDTRLKTITLSKGWRPTFPVPPALKLFKRPAKGKLPEAYLLTRVDGKPWGHSDWDELVGLWARKRSFLLACAFTRCGTASLPGNLPTDDHA